MSSIKPSKQRKIVLNASKHKLHKLVVAPLTMELIKEYGIKRISVRKGDTVRVMRGNNAGYEGKVTSLNLKRGRIAIEGLTRKKADGTPVYIWVHASKVQITKLELSDERRKKTIERKAKEERK
ncbi:50S ribosomal protein L24 [Acidianus sp. RZ1]|uniref:50S ribosomal protein L24 n=1 Tax=Acidianus sp. RZ1 TaxID=1540082 RepID=UPI0014926878|nr:50S ribosomal protein L24 [Acidianus sp. RZ1]NON62517.1 50S ribosomal protein L24 [Acidianus sp. RZ1]